MVVISIKSIDTDTKGTNDMFNKPAQTTKSTNKLKSLAAAAGIAVLLGACSTQAPETANERPAAPEVVNPVTTTTPSIETVVEPKTETPTPQTPSTVAPKPAAPDYVVGACGPGSISDGLEYEVVNIKDNDPDGGLVLRTAPNYNQPRIVTISEYSLVYSYGTADSCAVDSKGRTWWYVDAPGVASGWVNAYYLGIPLDEEFHHNEGVLVDETGFNADDSEHLVDIDQQHLDGELTDQELFENMQYDCLNGVTDCTEFYAIFGTGD